jgi:hypothetical protein
MVPCRVALENALSTTVSRLFMSMVPCRVALENALFGAVSRKAVSVGIETRQGQAGLVCRCIPADG